MLGRKQSRQALNSYEIGKNMPENPHFGNKKAIIPIFFVSILWFLYGGKRWIRIRARASVLARIAKRPAPKGGLWRNAPRGVNRAESTIPSIKKDTALRCLFFGGKRWIRTTEGGANRFTVCSLWPLGNLPTLGAGGRSRTNNLLITNQLLCH